jgi:hypothetical protein
MAHIAKFKATQVVPLLEHNARTDATRPHNHSNEDIDPSRTKDNYEMHDRGGLTAYEQYKQRMSELHCMQRKDVTVLDSLIVTLPKNVPAEDARKFFESAYAFACKDFGRENIVNATVHMDETTPHLHLGFIPVVRDKRRNGEECEKVCHKKLITKNYLKSFHQRMSYHIAKDIGYMPEIINGATENGNKTIAEMKAARAADRAADAEFDAKEKEKYAKKLQSDINALVDAVHALRDEEGKLTTEIEKSRQRAVDARSDADAAEQVISQKLETIDFLDEEIKLRQERVDELNTVQYQHMELYERMTQESAQYGEFMRRLRNRENGRGRGRE